MNIGTMEKSFMLEAVLDIDAEDIKIEETRNMYI